MISFLRLYFMLRKNNSLNEKRNVMFEANQYAKLFGYIGLAVMMIYFMGIGTMLGWASKGEDPEIILIMMPLILLIDFGMRFASVQTPMMLVKPYLLMPFSRYRAIDCFLIDRFISLDSLIWMSFFLPFVFIVVCGGVPFWQGMFMLLILHMMCMVNQQWYLLVRTLTNQHMAWWALPIALYGSIALPFVLMSDKQVDRTFDHLLAFLFDHGFSFASFLLLVVLLVVFFFINRHMQMHFIYSEISKQEKTKLKKVSEFKVLNRFGLVGEYLKLELKSTIRNKAIRSRFIQGICIIALLSVIVAYTDIYDNPIMLNIWCLYCFAFFGAVNLIKVMCPEGNYIDFLMVHEENILTLLRAKYFYYCSILLLPFLLLIPAIIAGKFSLLMILAYMLLTAGPIYAVLFLMAIFNKQTLPLNDKITGKNQMENKIQIIVSMGVFTVPLILVRLLAIVFGDTGSYLVLMVLGAAFVAAMPIWMRAIYKQMMKRRYDNMEGFHSSR